MLENFLFNETFNIGENCRLNAAVGNNGIQDHQVYGEGFDLTAKLLIRESKKGTIPIDAVIYPLLFCARHRLELFLKDQIMKLTFIRENGNITEKELVKTHDLNKLWEIFRVNAEKTDRRFLRFVDDAEEHINDFAKIDPTGETFRYPYDKYKTKHLINTPIINIGRFELRYKDISKKIKELECLADYLIEEYGEKTFTSVLSRNDIDDIATNLPERVSWGDDEFKRIKNEIMEKYAISSRKFSEALDIIQSHQEFCVKIGLEIPLAHLNTEILLIYMNIYNNLNNNATDKDGQLKSVSSYFKNQSACIKELQSKISKQSIICIHTLKELSKLSYLSEAFDRLYDIHMNEADIDVHYQQICRSIMSNPNALNLVKNSLIKTGQKALLKNCF